MKMRLKLVCKVREAKKLMEMNANKDHHILDRVHILKVAPCCGEVNNGGFKRKLWVVRVPHGHDHGSHVTSHKMLGRWDGNKGGQVERSLWREGDLAILSEQDKYTICWSGWGSSWKLSNLSQMVGLEREREMELSFKRECTSHQSHLKASFPIALSPFISNDLK